MSDYEEQSQSRPQRKVARTKGIEQHDQEMAEKKARLAEKEKKKNIQSQREAMKARDDAQDSPRPHKFAIVLNATPRLQSSARAKKPADDTGASPAPSAASDDASPGQDSDVEPRHASKHKARAASPSRFKEPTPPRRSTTTKDTSSRPKTKGSVSSSRPKACTDPSLAFEAATPPPEPATVKGTSARPKTKTRDDSLSLHQLITAITKRDQRFDHTEYDYETLKMIWNTKPKAKPALPNLNPDSSAQVSRHKGINALGSMDLDETTSQKSSSRGSKGTKSHSDTRSSISRHSTPVNTSRVASTTYRPSPVQLGPPARFRSVSAMSSRSSSPYVRSDHDVASDFDTSVVDELESEIAAQAPQRSSGKPRRADYQGPILQMLDITYEHACAHMVTEGFFLGVVARDELLTRYWKQAGREIGIDPNLPKYFIEQNHRRVTRYRLNSYQGRMKDAILEDLAAQYKIEGTPAEIKKRVAKLLPHGFHTKPNSPVGKGQYQHPFIQAAINAAFFNVTPKSTPIGVTHAAKFGGPDGMPLYTVALVCGIIEWGIKRYASGKLKEGGWMQGKAIDKIYQVHLQNLEKFQSINPDLAHIMRQKWYLSGRKNAKGAAPKAANQSLVPDASADLLILPDKPSDREREAVTRALKRFDRDRIKAPPASNESGGFDDVPGSGDSDCDKAFMVDPPCSATHDDLSPPPMRTARPKPRKAMPEQVFDEEESEHEAQVSPKRKNATPVLEDRKKGGMGEGAKDRRRAEGTFQNKGEGDDEGEADQGEEGEGSDRGEEQGQGYGQSKRQKAGMGSFKPGGVGKGNSGGGGKTKGWNETETETEGAGVGEDEDEGKGEGECGDEGEGVAEDPRPGTGKGKSQGRNGGKLEVIDKGSAKSGGKGVSRQGSAVVRARPKTRQASDWTDDDELRGSSANPVKTRAAHGTNDPKNRPANSHSRLSQTPRLANLKRTRDDTDEEFKLSGEEEIQPKRPNKGKLRA